MASKPRAPLYTLPIIVGIAFLTFAAIAAWRRADLIATLTYQLAHGGNVHAVDAVRQLAAVSNPPLPILVEAAACDERVTVEAAQIAINRLLDGWQQEVDNHQRVSGVAGQVSQLAAALAAQRRTFPDSSYPWLTSVAHKLVHVADRCPPMTTPLLALHCDEIMAQVATASYATAGGASRPSALPPTKQISAVSLGVINQQAERTQLNQTFATFGSVSPAFGASTPDTAAPSTPNVGKGDVATHAPQNPLRHELAPPPQGDDPHELGPKADSISALDPSTMASELTIPGNSLRSNSAESRVTTTGSSRASRSTIAPATYSTRELFERWRSTSGDEQRNIEYQLTARGFKHLSPALVEQYLSSDDERTHIVDSVLKLPGAEIRPWLFLLADDEVADVRLMAVTVMATSDDRTLIEKAWQISIRDEDPRIADLSSRLRERRARTQLR